MYIRPVKRIHIVSVLFIHDHSVLKRHANKQIIDEIKKCTLRNHGLKQQL
jgi:hypothetical protein